MNDAFVDLDQPIVVSVKGKERFNGIAPRTVAVLSRTLAERGDPSLMFSAEVAVDTAR